MTLRRKPAAFTLLELLLVATLIGILVAVALPSVQPAVYDQVRCGAEIMATDLAYARSLAVANNSNYRVTFDFRENRYVLEHSGINTALRQLPASPFSSPGDPPDKHIVDFDDLPNTGPTIHLLAAATGTTMQPTSSVEFGPLGQTTCDDMATIWLSAGSGERQRYITLTINPVTGLALTGAYSDSAPPAQAMPSR